MKLYKYKKFRVIHQDGGLEQDKILIVRDTDPASTMSVPKAEAWHLMEILAEMFTNDINEN